MRSNEPQVENEIMPEMYGFSVLFTHPKRLREFEDRRNTGKEKPEDPEPQVMCQFISWFDGIELKGVGIVGFGYIVNDNGKTIEKV